MKTEAQKKAQKKYMSKVRGTTKRQVSVTIDTADFEFIDSYAKEHDISKAQLIVKAIRYVADNDIDLKGEE